MYHTVQEVAELLKLSRRSVYRMIEAGRLEAVKVGREWRISDDSLASLLDRTGAVNEAGEVYRVGQAPRGRQSRTGSFMTADEYLALPEDSAPANLVQGLLIRDPAPSASHQELVGRLYIILHEGVRQRGLGVVYLSPIDVVLDGDTVLQPDLVVISSERRQIIDDRVRGAPDLVVEVSSPTTEERDLTTKRLLYARHGVQECWFVVGRDRKLIQVSQPEVDSYRQRVIHEAPAQVTSARFPNLVVDTGSLFEDY
ncbi:MAG: Uma2 family endonuclease [Bacillota bacterium]